ncbi:acireductone dioxygenase-like [Glandiceps talaboti]
MVRAWYMDDSEDDQRKEHMTDPPQFLDLEYLKEQGVLYWKLDVDNLKEEGTLDKIKTERGYTYEDEIECTPEKLENYEQKLKIFFIEHMHADEEIRLFMDGSGYFDIRDKNDKWVRIECVKGDMLILPAGIYHRFTMDEKDYTKAKRFFVGEPVWTPHNRPCEEHPARKGYVENFPSSAK